MTCAPAYRVLAPPSPNTSAGELHHPPGFGITVTSSICLSPPNACEGNTLTAWICKFATSQIIGGAGSSGHLSLSLS